MRRETPSIDAPVQEWFYHFRLVKHLPAMKILFNDAASKTLKTQDKRKIRTAFAAAALDVAWMHKCHENGSDSLRNLQEWVGVPATTLIGLDTQDISHLLGDVTAEDVSKRLQKMGFEISAKGLIATHTAPKP